MLYICRHCVIKPAPPSGFRDPQLANYFHALGRMRTSRLEKPWFVSDRCQVREVRPQNETKGMWVTERVQVQQKPSQLLINVRSQTVTGKYVATH
jgi:hypothetical protein